MMPRPCIRPQKSPPGPHVHNRAVLHQRHSAPGASTDTPARPPENDAPLRSPVPGDGECVCDAGAPDGDAIAGDGTAGPASGAGHPGVPVRRAPAVGGSAGASGHPAHGRSRGASPDRTPITTTDTGQGLAPWQDRQRRRSHHSAHVQGQTPLPHPVWPQAWHDRRAGSWLHLCPASAPGQSE
jgi:hypothetical protein